MVKSERQIMARELGSQVGSGGGPEGREVRRSPGVAIIPNPKAKLLDQVREVMRLGIVQS